MHPKEIKKAVIQERIMSVVLLDEYKSSKSENVKQEVIAERAHILEMVSHKSQERPLTLQETTDLYTQFNSTYETTYASKVKNKEDESWALKLLQDCEDDASKKSTFETRVNGIPLANIAKVSKQNLQVVMTDTKASNQNFHPQEDIILVKDKPKLRDSFIYDQFNIHYDAASSKTYQKSHKMFASIMAISMAITLSALIGGALFL
tara:strand:+ start:260 stop:877 length:618 start_codon:yes stop_codon:yes gene_type:complete